MPSTSPIAFRLKNARSGKLHQLAHGPRHNGQRTHGEPCAPRVSRTPRRVMFDAPPHGA